MKWFSDMSEEGKGATVFLVLMILPFVVLTIGAVVIEVIKVLYPNGVGG